MIQDSQTNYLYLADTLPQKHPEFYGRLKNLLTESSIDYSLLPGTKDIWVVDYMPVQLGNNNFIQFKYDPGYLYPDWVNTISDVDSICNNIGLEVIKSNIVLDGGNVVKGKGHIIMCDRVFSENPHIEKDNLIARFKILFQVERITFIPTDKYDVIGHADGMVRFVDDKTVVINSYPKKEKQLEIKLKDILSKSGLNYVEIAYDLSANKKNIQANGIYINYLQMDGIIVLPIFNIQSDEIAVKQFEGIFSGKTIKTIECNSIANDGGVLNCITWNIKK